MVANEILANIWLSDSITALDQSFLKQHNIKIVLNCTKNKPFTSLDITKYRLEVNDALQAIDQQDMLNGLDKMTKMMIIAYKTLTPMLIYCHAGVQRSATVIAAFMIRTTGIHYTNAIKFIQTKREITFRPGINFLAALQEFSKNKFSDIDDQTEDQPNN